jgi:hypothetical protein
VAHSGNVYKFTKKCKLYTVDKDNIARIKITKKVIIDLIMTISLNTDIALKPCNNNDEKFILEHPKYLTPLFVSTYEIGSLDLISDAGKLFQDSGILVILTIISAGINEKLPKLIL